MLQQTKLKRPIYLPAASTPDLHNQYYWLDKSSVFSSSRVLLGSVEERWGTFGAGAGLRFSD